jgi:hypothetical protein
MANGFTLHEDCQIFIFNGSHVIPDRYPGPTFKKLGIMKIVMLTRTGITFFFKHPLHVGRTTLGNVLS